jgi:hypothetical protein
VLAQWNGIAILSVLLFLRTAAEHSIWHDMLIRLLARVIVNNHEEAIAALSLAPDEQIEIRSKEERFSTHRPGVEKNRALNDNIELTAYVKCGRS